jgi:hypothetical protein
MEKDKDPVFAHRERLYRKHGNEIFTRPLFWERLGPYLGAWLKCTEHAHALIPQEVTNFFQPYEPN